MKEVANCVAPKTVERQTALMTAIVYLSEILIASLLAIVPPAISQLRMSSDAVLFAGGVVALTLAEYVVHRFCAVFVVSRQTNIGYIMPIPTTRSSQFFGKFAFCFALVYLIAGGAFIAGALVAYAGYLFVHHCAHHGPDKLPLPLLKRHIIRAITKLRPETMVSARHFGTMYSGRCCDD